MEKRSSEDWYKDIKDVKILDPDGWDRSNFEESWNELITKEEFDLRMMFSTCTFRWDKK